MSQKLQESGKAYEEYHRNFIAGDSNANGDWDLFFDKKTGKFSSKLTRSGFSAVETELTTEQAVREYLERVVPPVIVRHLKFVP